MPTVAAPRLQLQARDAHQPARRKEPQRAQIVFDHPVHAFARQAVGLAERRYRPVLEHAQSAL
jgi:hypothetical protein